MTCTWADPCRVSPDFEVFVPGVPRPQGSKSRGKNGHMYEASKHVKAWRQTIVREALTVLLDVDPDQRIKPALQGPIVLGVEFIFARPKSHFYDRRCDRCQGSNAFRSVICTRCAGCRRLMVPKPRIPEFVISTPDLDKLMRAVQDSLKTTGVYKDDSQVVGYAGFPITCKRYANPGEDPGARIRVWRVP